MWMCGLLANIINRKYPFGLVISKWQKRNCWFVIFQLYFHIILKDLRENTSSMEANEALDSVTFIWSKDKIVFLCNTIHFTDYWGQMMSRFQRQIDAPIEKYLQNCCHFPYSLKVINTTHYKYNNLFVEVYIRNVEVALQINILLETIMQKENILYLYTDSRKWFFLWFSKKISLTQNILFFSTSKIRHTRFDPLHQVSQQNILFFKTLKYFTFHELWVW